MVPFFAVQILLSAAIYLFDFVSTGIVVVHYGISTVAHLICKTNGDGGCNSFPSQAHTHQIQLRIFFAFMLLVLLCAHIFNAIFFKFNYNSSDAPLIFIYFLPLVHLHRLGNLLWRSCSCKGVEDIVSQEMNSVYSFLGIALETGPLFILQVSALQLIGEVHGHVIDYHASVSLKLSMLASLISAGYNGSMSIQFAAKNAVTFKSKALVALAAGISTPCFMWLTGLMYCSAANTERPIFPILLVVTTMLTNTTLYYLLANLKAMDINLAKWQKFIRGLGLSYMTLTLGPLYPLMSGIHMQKYFGTWNYRFLVLLMYMVNLLPSLITLFVLPNYISGLPVPITLYPLVTTYKASATLSSSFYGASIVAYVLTDWACGRKHVSQDVDIHTGPFNQEEQEDIDLLHAGVNHVVSPNLIQVTRTRSYPVERSSNSLQGYLQMCRLNSWAPR